MLFRVFGVIVGFTSCLSQVYASNLDYRFAAEALQKTKQAESVILDLPPDLRKAAILAVGGTLNLKIGEWGKSEIQQGELSNQEFFMVMAASVRGLALMTQQLNWNEATVCHLREAAVLDDLAAGLKAKPVNCRSEVYGPIQVEALRQGAQLDSPKVAVAINGWVTNTILGSFYSVRSARK